MPVQLETSGQVGTWYDKEEEANYRRALGHGKKFRFSKYDSKLLVGAEQVNDIIKFMGFFVFLFLFLSCYGTNGS